jgi:hypothetical protein
MALSTFREAPAPGFAPPLEGEIDWHSSAVEEMEKVEEAREIQEEKVLVLAR